MSHSNNTKKPGTLKLLFAVSRPEFLPANSASLIIGLAWGLTLPLDVFWGVALPLILAFAALSFVGAFAAHINTYADYELDQKDDTKKKLTAAMSQLGKGKLKTAMIIEVAISLMFILAPSFLQTKPVLLLMWMATVFLAFAYSAKSLRLKSHSFFAFLTLLTVLSALPVTFVTYVLTSRFDLAFLLFWLGKL